MDEYKVKQIRPNHCDHISGYKDKFLLPLFKEEAVIAQPKYDGERMLIHINYPEVYCTSRRFSKKTDRYMENQDKLPELQKHIEAFKNIGYTVIDCECYSKDWSTIVGILHSLPERAIELQKENTPKFSVFDCLFFDGEDLREKTYLERLAYAKAAVSMFNYEPLHLVKFMNDDYVPDDYKSATFIKDNAQWQACMQNAIDIGFEGIVVKSLQKKYYDVGASLKCKKFETVDCVVIDYEMGNGKYADTIGALSIGYYDPTTSNFVVISNVNCGSDAERDMWFKNWSTLRYSVIEVLCQEITEKSLRHPRYVRRREDKDYTMCTKETIFKGE